MSDQDSALQKVRKLLDRANHPNTPEGERDLCLQRADALMFKHALDEAMVDSAKGSTSREPISKEMDLYEGSSRWDSKFRTILGSLARTVRCRLVVRYNGTGVVVGMPDDVSYLEMLWTTVYLSFVSRIKPKWDNNLSFDHNVYNFKKAGRSWPEIRDIARANLHHVPWPDGGALIRAYKRHAKMIGDEELVKTQRHAAYRESFAEGFTRTICARLEEMRDAQQEATEDSAPGSALALRSVDERVTEAFYNMFPDRRPMSDDELQKLREEIAEREAREARERQEMLDGMTEKQRMAFLEKEARQAEREDRRFWRDHQKRQDATYDASGMAAGRRAGEQTDLTGGSEGMGVGRRGEVGS